MGWLIEGPWGTKNGIYYFAELSDIRADDTFPNGEPFDLDRMVQIMDRENDCLRWEIILPNHMVVTVWND